MKTQETHECRIISKKKQKKLSSRINVEHDYGLLESYTIIHETRECIIKSEWQKKEIIISNKNRTRS